MREECDMLVTERRFVWDQPVADDESSNAKTTANGANGDIKVE